LKAVSEAKLPSAAAARNDGMGREKLDLGKAPAEGE